MTEPLTPEQHDRLREIKSMPEGEGLDPHQRLRLACLQIAGRLGVRCDPRAAAEDLFDYVLHGAPPPGGGRGMIVRALQSWSLRVRAHRAPDFVIGGADRPYLRRWWVIPRNRFFNIYLHEIIRSDDDGALHDHPWWNCSILLWGGYIEHTIDAGGIERRAMREAGSIKFRRAGAAHRLEVLPGIPAVSLFITGPRIRDWGFHCPRAGWVHWRDFTASRNGETVGRGCGEIDVLPSFHNASVADAGVRDHA